MHTQNQNLYCVIMAGGVGTRFWPMSRQQRPKQFLDILGTGRTLLQQTYDRFKKIMPEENILIVTNKGYKSLVFEQLQGISNNQVLLEPSRRNTAPCIAFALSKIGSKNPDANVVVAPSDHLILKEEAFLDQVMKGFAFSEANPAIVTLGIRPSRPDTGYGYIQYIHEDAGSEVCKVKTFTEKPNADLAKSFLSSGEFLWNSGLFITTTKVMLHAFQKYLPDMYHVFQDGTANYFTEKEEAFLELAYAQCTNISIDYGIIEKADNVYVIPSEFGWSDLGTWGSLYENSARDANQNAVVGRKSMLYDTKNCIINVPKEKLVVVQGLDGYIVVESDGILLICKKDNEQEIRQMVSNVKVQRGEEYI